MKLADLTATLALRFGRITFDLLKRVKLSGKHPMKSLLVDNRVLLVNNLSRKQQTPLFTAVNLFLSDTVHYEISVGKLFQFISVYKVAFCFKLQNLFFQRSVLIYFAIFENIASRYDRSCNDIRSDCQIGHFRITSGLFFEASLGSHPFICKSILIHMHIKLIFI